MPSRTNQLADAIIAKAMTDQVFRSQLLGDPREAVEAFLGQKLPDDASIRVLEELPKGLTLVLPAQPSEAQALEDQELDSISGGLPTGVDPLDQKIVIKH
ncbi:MAG: NHLP leader peptide family RiPP precursor [Holophaga sp.]|nr:NHLP leader peptide family RiPP precursor [Holophaga sp.]